MITSSGTAEAKYKGLWKYEGSRSCLLW